ncbi:hypothetical protein NPIL_615901, partial [Nephila pilipes]
MKFGKMSEKLCLFLEDIQLFFVSKRIENSKLGWLDHYTRTVLKIPGKPPCSEKYNLWQARAKKVFIRLLKVPITRSSTKDTPRKERNLQLRKVKVGFVIEENEGESVRENLYETDAAFDNLEEATSDLAISCESYVNVNQDEDMSSEITEANIFAQVIEINQTEDSECGNAEGQKIQENILPNAAEAVIHMHELQLFFED